MGKIVGNVLNSLPLIKYLLQSYGKCMALVISAKALYLPSYT